MMLAAPALLPVIGIAISGVLAPFASVGLLAVCRDVAEGRMPTLEEINRAAPETPVFVLHLYESAMLNRAAIRALGFDKNTPNPPGGLIARDASGNPTGILKDAAQSYVYRVIPAPTREQRIRTLNRALADEMQPLDQMRARLVSIDKAGEQLCIHAIGDRAISMVLDLLGDVARANGPRDRRPRIEHSQHVAARDFDRYATLGVIASVQPYHAIDDGKWAEKRIGPERAKTTYAFRSFADHAVRLAFGSDWPVAPLDPLQGIYAAVTRATLDGLRPNGWVPEQKVSVAQALEAFTIGAAYAEFMETQKGSLTPGKLADMVLLTANPFEAAPKALREVRVDVTIAGGRVVYERERTDRSR
jgi:predicted amidohydrolase YtcJ